MGYNDMIDRNAADALIEESVERQIFQGMTEGSVVMRLGTRLQDIPASKHRMPVLSMLPEAYFVSGDTGLKQTTKMAWENKYLTAEELAVIVPIPEAVLDDSSYPIWSEVQPRLIEALNRRFDRAVLFGDGAPSSWPGGIVPGAVATHHYVEGDVTYDHIFAEGGVIAKVEESGYFVTGHVGSIGLRAKLRGLKDNQERPLFLRSMQDNVRYELDGEPLEFGRGIWVSNYDDGTNTYSGIALISGDFSQLVYAFRQGIRWKVLTEAVIQDASGNIVYNLAQQDMVALRVTVRLAWQIPNPVNPEDTSADRFPFAFLCETRTANQ